MGTSPSLDLDLDWSCQDNCCVSKLESDTIWSVTNYSLLASLSPSNKKMLIIPSSECPRCLVTSFWSDVGDVVSVVTRLSRQNMTGD